MIVDGKDEAQCDKTEMKQGIAWLVDFVDEQFFRNFLKLCRLTIAATKRK